MKTMGQWSVMGLGLMDSFESPDPGLNYAGLIVVGPLSAEAVNPGAEAQQMPGSVVRLERHILQPSVNGKRAACRLV